MQINSWGHNLFKGYLTVTSKKDCCQKQHWHLKGCVKLLLQTYINNGLAISLLVKLKTGLQIIIPTPKLMSRCSELTMLVYTGLCNHRENDCHQNRRKIKYADCCHMGHVLKMCIVTLTQQNKNMNINHLEDVTFNEPQIYLDHS